jgi:hypothetical protein
VRRSLASTDATGWIFWAQKAKERLPWNSFLNDNIRVSNFKSKRRSISFVNRLPLRCSVSDCTPPVARPDLSKVELSLENGARLRNGAVPFHAVEASNEESQYIACAMILGTVRMDQKSSI